MSTIINGYLVSPPKGKAVSWPATGNISGVSYSNVKNAFSRGSSHNPRAVFKQLQAKQNFMDKTIGKGHNSSKIKPTTHLFFGGKTRRRRTKSRKTRRV